MCRKAEMNEPKQYRKKPVVIEAIQFVESNLYHVVDFVEWDGGEIRGYEVSSEDDAVSAFYIHTLEGDMRVQSTDWVIKGVEGEFYPCRDDIFKQTYEEVGWTRTELSS